MTHNYSVLPRPFSKGGTPCRVLMTPCLFQEAEMTPCLFLVTPNDALLQFLFCPERQSAVIGAETTRCVSLFYSTAFVIVIRLVYKNLCYWPIRIYFGMLATDCCITFIQWKARTPFTCSRCTLFRFWFSPVFQNQRLDLC